jgi:LysR family transcriptional activator of nhaA
MKAFGEAGAGVFPTPAAGVPDVTAHYQVVKLGETEEIRERFFLISAERRLTHPAARAVSENARAGVFATLPERRLKAPGAREMLQAAGNHS